MRRTIFVVAIGTILTLAFKPLLAALWFNPNDPVNWISAALVVAILILVTHYAAPWLSYRPTRIYLDGSNMQLQLGNLAATVGSSDPPQSLTPMAPLSLSSDAITAITLCRIEGQQQLIVDTLDRSLAVGEGLTEPEREWLTELLGQWAGITIRDEEMRKELPMAPCVDRRLLCATNLRYSHYGNTLRITIRYKSLDVYCFAALGGVSFFVSIISSFLILSVVTMIRNGLMSTMLILFPLLLLCLYMALSACSATREVIQLRPTHLQHNAGRYHTHYCYSDISRSRFFASAMRNRVVTLPRARIERISVERVGKADRLTIQCGAQRIEVGKFLSSNERLVLAQLLTRYVLSGPEDVINLLANVKLNSRCENV